MQETTIPKRIVIYAKDISNITGRKERASRKLLAQIRIKNKKKNGEFITVKDFCNFTGLDEALVGKFLI
jgi:hypothetical protein